MSQYCQSRLSGFSNLVMPTPTMYDFMAAQPSLPLSDGPSDSGRGRRLTEGREPGQCLAECEGVHLGGALVGEDGLQVVGVADHRVFERDAVGAEDRAGGAADLDGLAD